jgi:hypothetical protein
MACDMRRSWLWKCRTLRGGLLKRMRGWVILRVCVEGYIHADSELCQCLTNNVGSVSVQRVSLGIV